MQVPLQVERRRRPETLEDLQAMLAEDRPLILEGFLEDVPGVANWNAEALASQCGNARFRVIAAGVEHVPGAGDQVDLTLGELLQKFRDDSDQREDKRRFYMAGPDLLSHPDRELLSSLVDDCRGFFENRVVSSRVSCLGFWCGKDGQRTWLHFDCANNLMLEIRGTKRFLLAPPSAYPSLYCYTFSSSKGQDMDGEIYRFSEVNVLEPDLERHPRAARVPLHEAIIGPGDTLLVPLGWFHHVQSSGDPVDGLNIALNCFFDASPQQWETRKYLKSFRQTYAPK